VTLTLGSLKVIENDTIQSGTRDFLLTFHSNHRPSSHRFRDKWQLKLKIANFPFPPRVFCAPADGVPPGSIGMGSEKTGMMGLPGGGESFKIDLAV